MPGRARHEIDPRLTALVVASASFMASLDGTIIALALPRMARSFGTEPIALTIGITAYVVVMASMLPASGWIADRFGPRRVLVAAIAGFTAASILCGISRDLGMFVVARVVQASCAALMAPVGNQILYASTPKKDFVSVVAISTTPALVAPVIGPALGGMIISALDWPWVFFLNVPIGLFGILLTLRVIPAIAPAPPRPFDWRGFLLSGAALVSLIYGLELATAGSSILLALVLIAAGLGLGVLAVRHIAAAAHPILSFAPLRVRTFVTATLTGGALVRIPFRGLNFILPLMLQEALGFGPLGAGLLLLGYNGGDLALKAVAGRVLRRFGFRTCLVAGGIATALATALLILLSRATPWPLVFAMLLAAGAFRSVLFTSMLALTFAEVPSDELAHGTILNNMASQVVGAFAISVSGLLLSASAAFRNGTPAHIEIWDYRFGLAVMALIGAAAVPLFRRLPANAGAEVSGHAPAAGT